MQQLTCTNCQHIYTDTFCNHCGQKATHRYTVSHVLHELVHVFTHADKGIFSFAWQIVKKPGIVALDLVEGRRKRYFNLFQYLIIIVGIVAFLITKTGFFDRTMQNAIAIGNAKPSGQLLVAQQKASQLIQQYNNILQMLLIPMFSFFGWLFFTRKKINYAETVVLHTASSAQSNTLALLTTILMFFGNSNRAIMFITVLSLLIMLYCFAITYYQFFKMPFWKALLYSFLVFVCTYIVQIFVTAVFFIVYVMLVI